MTPKTIIMGLCICVFIAATLAIAMALFSNYLVDRNAKLETQNEHKTELICALNNRLDEAQKDYNDLEKEYTKLMYKERKKENGRG